MRRLLAEFARDLRYGWRLLAESPGFAAITILALAFGIGANTALFSLVDCLLLRPLPYPEPERLAVVWSRPPRGGVANVSAANFLDYRRQSQSFDHLAALMAAEFNVRVQGVAERLSGFRASAEVFAVLGVGPFLGRGFSAADDRPGAPRVAVLGYAAWQRRFGADRGIVGRSLIVDGQPCTVIGVMPAGFRFVMAPELWLPLALDPATAPRDFHVLFVAARLRPAVAITQAGAEMAGLARNLERAYPKALQGWGVEVWPWRENFVAFERRRSLVLLGAVGCVLLIACVNVANLLLARAAARRGELAVRAALGAGRARLMRQVLTESLLLAALGGGAGVLLARALMPLVSGLIWPPLLAGLPPLGLDARVLWFTVALSAATGILFGMAPAWRAARVDLNSELKVGLRGRSTGRDSARSVLVVAEVALSLVLLAGAGLMLRSLAALDSADPGFRPENVLTLRLTMPEARYGKPERVREFSRAVLERVRALPGVRAAALAHAVPLENFILPMRFQIAGRPWPAAENPSEAFQYASEDYFETLRMSLRRGRVFTARDNETAPPVVVVNEAFAAHYFPGESPIGHRLLLDPHWTGGAAGQAWEIVGVVSNVKITGLEDSPLPQMYGPLWQCARPARVLAVRTDRDPAASAPALRAAVHAVDRDVPVTQVRTMREIAAAALAEPRTQAWIIGSFAAVALILAALGIYGVMSYTAAQRTHEMGIRMALGAEARDVLLLMLRKGLVLAGTGVALGVAGALALTRTAAGMLYNVKPADPLTYTVACGVLLAAAVGASIIPARRAARVQPAQALRWE